jgi:hypothetical protein
VVLAHCTLAKAISPEWKEAWVAQRTSYGTKNMRKLTSPLSQSHSGHLPPGIRDGATVCSVLGLPVGDALHLPKPNVFVASDFTLVQHAVTRIDPALVDRPVDAAHLWFKPDSHFKTPLASM